jgi:hypothetical protein
MQRERWRPGGVCGGVADAVEEVVGHRPVVVVVVAAPYLYFQEDGVPVGRDGMASGVYPVL